MEPALALLLVDPAEAPEQIFELRAGHAGIAGLQCRHAGGMPEAGQQFDDLVALEAWEEKGSGVFFETALLFR
jgi:hypothetical protein